MYSSPEKGVLARRVFRSILLFEAALPFFFK